MRLTVLCYAPVRWSAQIHSTRSCQVYNIHICTAQRYPAECKAAVQPCHTRDCYRSIAIAVCTYIHPSTCACLSLGKPFGFKLRMARRVSHRNDQIICIMTPIQNILHVCGPDTVAFVQQLSPSKARALLVVCPITLSALPACCMLTLTECLT